MEISGFSSPQAVPPEDKVPTHEHGQLANEIGNVYENFTVVFRRDITNFTAGPVKEALASVNPLITMMENIDKSTNTLYKNSFHESFPGFEDTLTTLKGLQPEINSAITDLSSFRKFDPSLESILKLARQINPLITHLN